MHPQYAPNVPQRPFSPPHLFRQDGKDGAAGGTSETASTERVSAMREAAYPLKSVSSSFPPNRIAGFAGNLRCQQNKPLIMQSNAHDKGHLCFYR